LHHRRIIAAALGYPLALLLLVALLRGVGERWWLTTVGLYLPALLFALPLPVLCWRLWRHGPRRWLASQLGAALVLIFPLGGFVLPGPARRDNGAPTVRVLSYNVMHAYAGPPRIMAEIERWAPDVVLLQKLVANQEELGRLLRARYPHVELSWGSAVASRFPILSRHDPDQPLAAEVSAQARFTQRVIATPLGPIAFYNAHPVSPRDGLVAVAGLKKGALALLERETAWRAAQVGRLAARARAESLPVVIAGDTNLPTLSPLLRAQLGHYRDGFEEAGWGFGWTYPLNAFCWMRIDRVMTSEALRVVHFQRGGSDASDHRAVIADLQRR
jgi:endonuclease/exonuclease/phosphatase (EEP) superfamily protein YafD